MVRVDIKLNPVTYEVYEHNIHSWISTREPIKIIQQNKIIYNHLYHKMGNFDSIKLYLTNPDSEHCDKINFDDLKAPAL